jgi:aspartyl/asparaginyl beta-hydroxylase (cupin superfamily)
LLAGDLRGASTWYRGVLNLAAQGRAVSILDRRGAEASLEWVNLRIRDVLLSGLDAAGLTAAERHPRFQKSLDIMLGDLPHQIVGDEYPQTPQTYFYPDLPYFEFVDTAQLSWRAELEEKTGAITAEALALLDDRNAFSPYVKKQADRPQGDVHGMLGNSDWSTWELTDRGVELADRTAQAPVTAGAMAEVPLCRIANRAPTPMFSLLRPQSRIPPHTGMINARFICHLPLVVPEGCGFRVGSQTRPWQVGELMVFDDSIEHEAWNDSDQDRMILLFDVWRPELEPVECAQIDALFRVVDSY